MSVTLAGLRSRRWAFCLEPELELKIRKSRRSV